jgi:hypothetical protein
MKHLCVFTKADDQTKVAVRRFDIVGLGEIDRLRTRVSFSMYDGDDSGINTIEVVGSFEETVEKIEAHE